MGLFILILIVGISSLFGLTIEYTDTHGPVSADWDNVTLSVPKCNTTIYQGLTQVDVYLDLENKAEGSAENNLVEPVDITIGATTTLTVYPPDTNPKQLGAAGTSGELPYIALEKKYFSDFASPTYPAILGTAFQQTWDYDINDPQDAIIINTYFVGTSGTYDFSTDATTLNGFSGGTGGPTLDVTLILSVEATATLRVVYTYDSQVPVNLSAFYANYIGGVPTIYWTTQTEENNEYWNVYRGTTQDFEAANQINSNPVPGNGTTNYASDYIFVDSVPVQQNTTYWYWIEDVATDGETTIHEPITLSIPFEDTPVELDIYGLEQNYPNPFNPSTSISFSLEEYSEVELTIYNLNGQKIKDLEVVRTGLDGSALWDGNDENGKQVSSGVYFYKLTTDNKVYQKKMLLVK